MKASAVDTLMELLILGMRAFIVLVFTGADEALDTIGTGGSSVTELLLIVALEWLSVGAPF